MSQDKANSDQSAGQGCGSMLRHASGGSSMGSIATLILLAVNVVMAAMGVTGVVIGLLTAGGAASPIAAA